MNQDVQKNYSLYQAKPTTIRSPGASGDLWLKWLEQNHEKYSFFKIVPHRSRCIKYKSFFRFSKFFNIAYFHWSLFQPISEENLKYFENLASDAIPGGACTFNILGLSDLMTPCICCDVTGDVIQGDVTIKSKNKSVVGHFIILFMCFNRESLLRACKVLLIG